MNDLSAVTVAPTAVQRSVWSIGIYAGASPLALAPAYGHPNPVLDRTRVRDVPAAFVADPFLIRRQGIWHMFFEVMLAGENRGEIGHAESADGWDWEYRGIVLREPFHLSYPYVFEREGEQFMVPETLSAGAVRLYRGDPFPSRWVLAATLLPGLHADPSLVYFGGRFWMFTCPRPYQHDCLALFWANDLRGPWRPHDRNPIVRQNARAVRPAGRLVPWAGSLWRFAQQCSPHYGAGVRAFRIDDLTPTEYAESEHPESPIPPPESRGWNAGGMHHVDAQPLDDGSWLAAVDGQTKIRRPPG